MLRGYDHFFPMNDWRRNIPDRSRGIARFAFGTPSGDSIFAARRDAYTGNRLGGGCPETKSGGRYRDYEGVAVVCQGVSRCGQSVGISFSAAWRPMVLLPEDRLSVRYFPVNGTASVRYVLLVAEMAHLEFGCLSSS